MKLKSLLFTVFLSIGSLSWIVAMKQEEKGDFLSKMIMSALSKLDMDINHVIASAHECSDQDLKSKIEKLIDLKVDLNSQDDMGRTLWLVTKIYQKVESQKLLIEAGVDTSDKEINIKEIIKKMWKLTDQALKPLIEHLIKQRVNLNTQDRKGKTLLTECILKTRPESARLLIEAGIGSISYKNHKTPLHYAIKKEKGTTIAEMLLEEGCDLKINGGLKNLLINAINRGRADMFQLLIAVAKNRETKPLERFQASTENESKQTLRARLKTILLCNNAMREKGLKFRIPRPILTNIFQGVVPVDCLNELFTNEEILKLAKKERDERIKKYKGKFYANIGGSSLGYDDRYLPYESEMWEPSEKIVEIIEDQIQELRRKNQEKALSEHKKRMIEKYKQLQDQQRQNNNK